MTHQDVLDQGIVRRYVAGKLPPEAAAAFEAHLFDCDECNDAVRADDQLRPAGPDVAVAGELPLEARASIAATTRGRLSAWVIFFAAAGLAAAVIGMQHQRATELARRLAAADQRSEALQGKFDSARAQTAGTVSASSPVEVNIPAVVLNYARPAATATRVTIPAGAEHVIVWIERCQTADSTELILRASSGPEVGRAPGLRPNERGALVASFPADAMPDGAYVLTHVQNGATVAEYLLTLSRDLR